MPSSAFASAGPVEEAGRSVAPRKQPRPGQVRHRRGEQTGGGHAFEAADAGVDDDARCKAGQLGGQPVAAIERPLPPQEHRQVGHEQRRHRTRKRLRPRLDEHPLRAHLAIRGAHPARARHRGPQLAVGRRRHDGAQRMRRADVLQGVDRALDQLRLGGVDDQVERDRPHAARAVAAARRAQHRLDGREVGGLVLGRHGRRHRRPSRARSSSDRSGPHDPEPYT